MIVVVRGWEGGRACGREEGVAGGEEEGRVGERARRGSEGRAGGNVEEKAVGVGGLARGWERAVRGRKKEELDNEGRKKEEQ